VTQPLKKCLHCIFGNQTKVIIKHRDSGCHCKLSRIGCPSWQVDFNMVEFLSQKSRHRG